MNIYKNKEPKDDNWIWQIFATAWCWAHDMQGYIMTKTVLCKIDKFGRSLQAQIDYKIL